MTAIDLARRFYTAFAASDLDAFDESLTPDRQLRPPLIGAPGTRHREKQTVANLHSVLGGITYTVDDINDTESGIVACRNTLRAICGLATPALSRFRW